MRRFMMPDPVFHCCRRRGALECGWTAPIPAFIRGAGTRGTLEAAVVTLTRFSKAFLGDAFSSMSDSRFITLMIFCFKKGLFFFLFGAWKFSTIYHMRRILTIRLLLRAFVPLIVICWIFVFFAIIINSITIVKGTLYQKCVFTSVLRCNFLHIEIRFQMVNLKPLHTLAKSMC